MTAPCHHTWRVEDPTEDAPVAVVYRCPRCAAERVFALGVGETPQSARNRMIAALLRGDVLEKAGVGDGAT